MEVLKDYAGDYIFFDESNGAEMDKKDKVWTSIEAVKKDRVFYLDAKRFWPFDPIAVLAQAEEVTDMIVSQKRRRKRSKHRYRCSPDRNAGGVECDVYPLFMKQRNGRP